MNKQELIEKYQDKLYEVCTKYGEYYRTIAYENILKDLENLDEPQKPVVPQFVADYIKYAIENDWDFQDLFKCIEDEEDEKLLRWFYHERNQETLATAWINGYEVEKEKRYLVKMKNLRALFCYLAYIPDEGYWTFMASGGESIVIKHTRKQLEEAGFGWVFDCEGMEVEEV
ncbi:DUF1642 domain-containing protein [Streptococcus sp. HMSC061E03]|jgi:hypothetical protein|uniref:DUF1642 domain-containing protein n=1 Tax=Streptococcus sp. HMSC061E03 TaxID=1739421 RepID=UPI0008A66524|nr:DUF1642 domain-containing protein [Streptococcus sp. HMSC061E03]OFQ87771.1 hypothetical protein HMPREF2917_05255 [Streptococcus sp. HMSC061E03]DAW28422.1 MAG TPA: Protein of unknown function (DUF1642) [Caudoviricetes sp.]